MSNVLPFLARAQPGGDWTDSERLKIEELAAHLAPGGTSVSTVFGATDVGDPWCVVTDENDEVLLHVARIGDRFVIHQAVQDVVRQGDTLWSAASRLLQADRAAERNAAVINLRDRDAQTVFAVVAGTGFESAPASPLASPASASLPIYADQHLGHDGVDDPSPTDAPRIEGADPAPAVIVDPDASSTLANARVGPTEADPAPTPVTATDTGLETPPREAAAKLALTTTTPVEAPSLLHGETPGPARMVINGGPGGDTLTGGPGDDRLDGHGAPHGQIDLLNGGAGNDRLILHENTVAIGGPGADTFVVIAPRTMAPPETAPSAGDHGGPAAPPSLGTVVDFDAHAGDRLQILGAARVTVVSEVAVPDVVAPELTGTSFSFAVAVPGVRVGLDFNGDGHEDGYVMLGGPDAASFTLNGPHSAAASAPLDAAEHWHEAMAAAHFTDGMALLG